MSLIPDHMLAKRREVSGRFVVGDGIEIGALHAPLWVSPRARVRYVDRMAAPALRHHYPELGEHELVAVDIVDNGETLCTIADGSLDFIIGNHLLEHCENPLGTVRRHLCKLREGGILYYAVPDKRFSFDVERPLTGFDHLVRDDREGPATSRLDHYREWACLVNKHIEPKAIEENVRVLVGMSYSIHFHVWDAEAYRDFLEGCRAYLGKAFAVRHFEQNDTEIISVLAKDRPASA